MERVSEAKDKVEPLRAKVSEAVHEAIDNNIPELLGRRLKDEDVLSEQGEVDSLGFIMVLTELEDKLGVTIPDEEWDGMRTFGDLVNKFVSKIKGEKAE